MSVGSWILSNIWSNIVGERSILIPLTASLGGVDPLIRFLELGQTPVSKLVLGPSAPISIRFGTDLKASFWPQRLYFLERLDNAIAQP